MLIISPQELLKMLEAAADIGHKHACKECAEHVKNNDMESLRKMQAHHANLQLNVFSEMIYKVKI